MIIQKVIQWQGICADDLLRQWSQKIFVCVKQKMKGKRQTLTLGSSSNELWDVNYITLYDLPKAQWLYFQILSVSQINRYPEEHTLPNFQNFQVSAGQEFSLKKQIQYWNKSIDQWEKMAYRNNEKDLRKDNINNVSVIIYLVIHTP